MLSLFQPQRCRKFLPFLFRAYSKKRPPSYTRSWPGNSGAERGMEMIWVSRELAYLLRHGAKSAGLPIRTDGYVEVEALLKHRSLRGLDFAKLETIVHNDSKQRYHLLKELRRGGTECWLIRANQGHSIPDVMGGLTRIHWAWQVSMAVHGTSMKAWEAISTQGLSRMSRNHIHFAQSVTGEVISGMRSSSEVLIFINLERALKAGMQFYLSSNGVVLTSGNEKGFLEPRFFSRVERRGVGPISGWEGVAEAEMAGNGKTATNDISQVGPGDVGAGSVTDHVAGEFPLLEESGEDKA
ncbi:tRNA 2'-phosphotransferase [Mycena venus]|uniref:2'-phosphotransferase n=1 Tax=Mycena venus TaxID=2733690 RepID=A0A8H6XS02_9AGAR|nr:tRNA 2'-phosphotransferase [Mycena venus]